MFDAGSRSDAGEAGARPVGPPRAEGRIAVSGRAAAGRTRLSHLFQQGSAKCLLPRVVGPGGALEAVLLNTAGGITGGDRFEIAAEAGPGARLTLATQAAERVYRAASGTGRIDTRLVLGTGARIDWLPQETILYDAGALARTLTVEMAADASLLAVEPFVLGRTAMGERVRQAAFTDDWRVYRAGRLVYADALSLTGAFERFAAPALLAGRTAGASLLYVAPDAEVRARGLAPGLDTPPEGCLAGLSACDGVLAARLLAPDGRRLRILLARLLAELRGELPRVWTL
ncbi:MAG: urease accessory protein UreD [Paracoccaceae bacterium]